MEKSIVIRLFVFPCPILCRQLTVCLIPFGNIVSLIVMQDGEMIGIINVSNIIKYVVSLLEKEL